MKKAFFKLTSIVLVMAVMICAAAAIHYPGSGEHKNAIYSGTLQGSIGEMGYYGKTTYPTSATNVKAFSGTWFAVADVYEYSCYSSAALNHAHYSNNVTSSNPNTGFSNCEISRSPSNVYYRYEHEGSLSVPGQGITPNTFKYTAHQH
ncbi:MAG: hypothetical protein IKR27_01935 [Lachnospiraceae bacterium]|nr:hypothetical protein [Lachnospiraceae bacterium]